MGLVSILVLAAHALVALFLALQGLHLAWLTVAYRRHRRAALTLERAELAVGPPDANTNTSLPHVLVQLPVFNEREVVERALAAVARLNWPKDRLRVQLLDDSDDDSLAVGAAAVARAAALDVDVQHVVRGHRDGFKAGALAHGLALDAEHPRGAAPLVAILDADFVVPEDFVWRAAVALESEPNAAFLQGRWQHLNAASSALTRAQAIGIDGHFAIEQAARAWSGLALNFNGSCGVWRREAIEAAGGWQPDTLTEDLDLSYRAQLAGRSVLFRSTLTVPGEISDTLEAWRSQQFRWAKGSVQTAQKLLPSVWRSSWALARKLGATAHLTHYFVHPALLASLLLAPLTAVVLEDRSGPWLALALTFVLVGLVSPLALYVVSQRAPARPWRAFLGLPALMSFGVGIAASNSRAVFEALRGARSPFVRTPKRGDGPGRYRAAPAGGLLELALGTLGALGFALVLRSESRWLLPLLALYSTGLLQHGLTLCVHRVRDACAAAGPAPEADRRGAFALIALGALFVCAIAAITIPGGERRGAPVRFAVFGLLAGSACYGATELVRRLRPTPGRYAWMIGVSLLALALGTRLPIALDTHRYTVEGLQLHAGQNPYSTPPAAPEVAAMMSGAYGDAVRAERFLADVNHAEMTAIYPPGMLALEAVVVALDPRPEGFRALALLAVLALLALLTAMLSRAGRSPLALVAFAWNPIVPLFLAGGAHHDGAMVVVLVAGVAALHAGRERLGLAALSLAALLKPFAVVARPVALARSGWRRAWIPAALAVAAFLPFIGAAEGLVASLFTFGGSMQSHGALEPLLRRGLAPWVPAESLGALVRVGLALVLTVGLTVIVARRERLGLDRAFVLAAACLLFVLPTLYPWYMTLLIALLPLAPLRPLVAWTCAAPLYFLHGLVMPPGADWSESPAVTMLAHAPFVVWFVIWAALAATRSSARLRGDPEASVTPELVATLQRRG